MKKAMRPGAMFLFPVLAVAQLLAGCSAEQTYSAGQNWQRNQCTRIPDRAEYDRCMADANRSYDTYRRETGASPK